MGLPLLFPPAGTPQFVVEGHTRSLVPVYEDVGMLVGHGLKRRVYTTVPQVATVAWILDTAQMAAVDDWFENALKVGTSKFTAQIAKLGAPWVEYWAAQWVDPYLAEPIPGGWWRVSGSLLLTGTPSATRPSTGALALELELALAGAAVVTQPTVLAIEISIALTSVTSLALEVVLGLTSFREGAEPSAVDQDKRWSWMRLPYAAGHSADLSLDEAARRNWMGF